MLFIHPVGYMRDIIIDTRHKSISNMDICACKQECKGKHGGSRSKLCWHDKLALLEDDTILDFLAHATCGAKCECFKKLRACPEAFTVIKDLREARFAQTCKQTKIILYIVLNNGDRTMLHLLSLRIVFSSVVNFVFIVVTRYDLVGLSCKVFRAVDDR